MLGEPDDGKPTLCELVTLRGSHVDFEHDPSALISVRVPVIIA